MKIKTNLLWIISILLKSNLLTICEGGCDIVHEPFIDHLDHLDHLDHFHQIDGPISKDYESTTQFQTNNVRQGQHNGDSFAEYATTSHTNQETNNELFHNMIPSIPKSNAPGSFTKVVKTTVIKHSNNNGNDSPETTSSMKDINSINKFEKTGNGNLMSKSQTISQTHHTDEMNYMDEMDHMDHMNKMYQMDHMENIGLPSISSQQSSDIQGNLKSAVHTTITKTTTSGSPSNQLSESINTMHSMDTLPSNQVISKISSTNSNYNDEIKGSGSLQPNLMGCNKKFKKMSMANDVNDFIDVKSIPSKPGGSNKYTKTIIIKQHSRDDNNGRSDLEKSAIQFDTENKSSNNIVSSMKTPLGYNQITTTTIDRDNINNNIFDNGSLSMNKKTNFNKFDVARNSVSETYNNGYNDDLDHYNGNFKNNYNGKIMSSNKLVDGSSSGGSYMINGEYKSYGNGMKKKKNIHMKTSKCKTSKNTSYEIRKGNKKRKVKNSRNIRSSTKRKVGAQNGSSNNRVKVQSKSFSSSGSSSDESSMNNEKKPCHCNKGRKLNKRNSNEINVNSITNKNHELASHYLKLNNSMQNIGNLITALLSQPPHMGYGPPQHSCMGHGPPPHLPMGHKPPQHPFMGQGPPPHPSMEHEPPSNPPIGHISPPNNSLNYSQSNQTTVLNGQDEMRNQQINDQQFPSIDVSNQHLTNQITKTSSQYKPDLEQEQHFGTQANSFGFSPFYGGENRPNSEQNRQPPPPHSISPYPYSFNQDNYSDLSKLGHIIPELTDIQSGQNNQVNINTELPQMQQDSENEVTGLKQMGKLDSGSMTTHIRSNIISKRNGSPIIEYVKTIKTTGNIDGTRDKHVVQTQSVSPEVDDNGNCILH